jgi:two-component system response regulator FixJ
MNSHQTAVDGAASPYNLFAGGGAGGGTGTSKSSAPESLPRFEGQTIVVVDDDPAICELLSLQLIASGLSVVPFRSAKALLASEQLANCHCIVSDVRMPDMDGLELQEELNQRKAGIPFVVITAHGDVPLAVRAMRAGAVDIIEKPFKPVRLLSAIERALSQGGEQEAAHAQKASARARLAELTPRERQIFDLIVASKQSKVIARELGISNRTVDIHRGNLMRKLRVKNVGELVRLAMSAS